MRYELLDYYKENNINILSLNHILQARGLDEERIELLMNLTEEVLISPFKMKNMREGINLLMKHVKNGSTIAILNDEDTDGVTSTSLLYLFLEENFGKEITLKYLLNKNKQHGVSIPHLDNYYPEYDFDLLIVPDANCDQKEADFLKEKGKDILILDHHINSQPSSGAITINPNQVGCRYPNKDLSGVGVVYKFCVAISEIFDTSNPDKYIDLVSVGMIGDVMSLKSPETRYLINEGLEKMQKRRDKIADSEGKHFPKEGNKFINACLFKKYDYDLKILTHKTVAFKIVPLINGCIRAGTMKEKEQMLKAFLGSEELSYYQPRRKYKDDPKPDPVPLPLYIDMVRLLTNIKNKQDTEAKKALEALEQRIEDKDLLKGKVLIVDATNLIKNKSLTGLVAQNLCSKYMRPTIVLKKRDEDRYGGSCRNFNYSPVESFKDLIESTGLAKGMGHNNACGFLVNTENLVEAWESMNEKLKDVVLEQVHKVDAIVPFRKLTKKKVMEIGRLHGIFGSDIPHPKIAITGVTVPVESIERIGDKGTIVKFTKNELSFYKFHANEEVANNMRMRERKGFGGKSPKHVVFDMIVQFEVNEFMGREYPQIVIEEYEVRAKEQVLF